MKWKMYILVRESVPTGWALLAAAHASLAAYLKFQDSAEVKAWLSGPFYKVICKVTDREFGEAKSHPEHVVITESALDSQEVAIAFKPRQTWPELFRTFRLYR